MFPLLVHTPLYPSQQPAAFPGWQILQTTGLGREVDTRLERVYRFKAALANAAIKFSEFSEHHGVSRQAIHQAIRNPRKSKRLNCAIEAFIREFASSQGSKPARRLA